MGVLILDMDTTIAFTPSQVLALCSAVVVLSGAVHVVINLFAKVSAPTKLQNVRLDAIEDRLEKHDDLFKKDLQRLENVDEANRVTQRAILALLSHGIDGNDIEELRKAKSELQEYLIKR